MKENIIKSIVLVIIVIIVLMIVITNLNEDKIYKDINKYVNNNYVELESIAKEYIKGNKVKVPENIKSITVHSPDKKHVKNDNTIVEFLYSGKGLVPSSTYYGFYYSLQDKPAAFQNEDFELLGTGHNQWKWFDDDNEGTTEKIRKNWYYYSATF